MSVPHPKGGAIFWTCVKDHIIDEKEDYKDIGLCGFDYKSFEEEEVRGNRMGLDGFPYLKHLIQFCPGDWVKQMAKINEAVGMKNYVTINGGKKRLVSPFKIQEFWKFIGCVLSEVTYGKKEHNLWSEIPKSFGKMEILNYKDMFVEKPIYIRYVVLTIIIFTSMLAIELFYLTQLHSFLGCFFEYLPLFLPYDFVVNL